MFEVISQMSRDHGAPIGVELANPFAISIRGLAKEVEKNYGFRPSLKKTRRALESWLKEGLLKELPPPPCRSLISPYNKPRALAITKKGLDRLAASRRGDAPPGPDLLSLNLDRKDTAILNCLVATCNKNGKLYCFPSQETILNNCRKYGDEDMARSTLNLHLDRLEAGGFFKRKHRHRLKADGTWEYRSTLYILCARAWAWVKKGLAMLTKAASFLGIRQIGHNPLTPGDLSWESGPSKATFLPRFGEKGATPPSDRDCKMSKPLFTAFNDLLAERDR